MSTDYLNTHLPKVKVLVTSQTDGSLGVESDLKLEPYPERLFEKLIEWAKKTPDHVFLAKRPAPGQPWNTLTFKDTLEKAHRQRAL